MMSFKPTAECSWRLSIISVTSHRPILLWSSSFPHGWWWNRQLWLIIHFPIGDKINFLHHFFFFWPPEWFAGITDGRLFLSFLSFTFFLCLQKLAGSSNRSDLYKQCIPGHNFSRSWKHMNGFPSEFGSPTRSDNQLLFMGVQTTTGSKNRRQRIFLENMTEPILCRHCPPCTFSSTGTPSLHSFFYSLVCA